MCRGQALFHRKPWIHRFFQSYLICTISRHTMCSVKILQCICYDRYSRVWESWGIWTIHSSLSGWLPEHSHLILRLVFIHLVYLLRRKKSTLCIDLCWKLTQYCCCCSWLSSCLDRPCFLFVFLVSLFHFVLWYHSCKRFLCCLT